MKCRHCNKRLKKAFKNKLYTLLCKKCYHKAMKDCRLKLHKEAVEYEESLYKKEEKNNG